MQLRPQQPESHEQPHDVTFAFGQNKKLITVKILLTAKSES